MWLAMTAGEIVLVLLIGVVSGWLAGVIVKGGGFGVLGDLVVGILGAYFGAFLFSAIGLAAYGILGTILMSVAGAVVLLLIFRALFRGQRTTR